LELFLDAVEVVARDLTVLLEVLELLAHVATDVAHRNAAVFRARLDDLHELLAPIGGGLGEREPDDCAVVRRCHTDIAGLDGLLDRFDRALVVGGDDEHTRLGHREAGKLLQRHFRPVVIDAQLLDDRGGRASGADAGELLLHVEDGLAHLVLGFVDLRVHQRSSPAEALTSVPIASPTNVRMMLPGWVTSNTMIGSELSMQNVIAVESITCRPRCNTSK